MHIIWLVGFCSKLKMNRMIVNQSRRQFSEDITWSLNEKPWKISGLLNTNSCTYSFALINCSYMKSNKMFLYQTWLIMTPHYVLCLDFLVGFLYCCTQNMPPLFGYLLYWHHLLSEITAHIGSPLRGWKQKHCGIKCCDTKLSNFSYF